MIIKIEIDTDLYDVNLIGKKTKTVWALSPDPGMDGTVIIPGGRMEKPKHLLCDRCHKNKAQHVTSNGHLCCECYVREGNTPCDWHELCMKTYEGMKSEFSEESLTLLMQFIRSPIMGGMINTYPSRDVTQNSTHKACLELEKRGLLERKIDDPEHILFVVKE